MFCSALQRLIPTILCALCQLAPSALCAATLHERVDELIAAKAGGVLAPAASDGEFLRRVYLDLNGTIPSPAEARQFFSDASPEKRAKLVDRLLASPDYAVRMAEAFDVMLMERRTRGDASSMGWREYLKAAFAANKSWEQIAREILCPEANDEATRFAALFYTRRLEKEGQQPTDYPGLTRDLGRLFIGVDLQCAACHNHKYIKDYKQADYQGLFAFVGQTFIRTDVKFPALGEKPLTSKIEYVSVFKPAEKHATGPRVPFGTENDVPAVAKGQEWEKPPDKKTNFPGTPKFSPLRLLSEQLARPDNQLFKQNIANRLWFLMMGRGLIHPVDLAHSENTPSHPELLQLLAEEFAAMKFDIKAFLRELALTHTYQRSSLLPVGEANVPPQSFRVALGKRISGEALARCALIACGELEAAKNVKAEKTKGKAGVADPTSDASEEERKPAKSAVTLQVLTQKFVTAFSGPAGEPETEFAASVAGALFLSNDQTVLSWLKRRSGNLMDRLAGLGDAAVAEELYLSVLTRMPGDEERADVAAYLAKNAKRREAALGELVWGLLASTEFCVDH